MKVVAFNGSPKKEGNTYHAIKMVAEELEKEGIEVEIVHVGNKTIGGCRACNACVKNNNEKCIIDNDEVNEWIQKMKMADGIILGSPVHYSAIGGTMKPGEALEDEEGRQIMRVLGKNMAWLMKLVENGKQTIKEPERENKILTNFIR
ncbi:MAG: NADPH-dependent reductase [Firmicutes bacterium]|nr:NADPH-dependent reductase [Bacillota bacterium]